MGDWLRRLKAWRPSKHVERNKAIHRRVLGFDNLESRLAPAITALPPGGAGLNMPKFPIESQVRTALNVPWTPLAVSVDSSLQGGAYNHNLTVPGAISIQNIGQVAISAITETGVALPVAINGSRFSFSTPFALNGAAEGSHSVTVTATDQSGRSASTTFAMTIDTVAPSIQTFDLDPASDTSPTGDQTTTAATVTLRGTTEAGATVVLVGSAATTTADASGAFSFANLALTVGSNAFQVRAVDRAGNQGAAFSRTITRQNPSASVAVTINPLITKSTSPTITGTVDNSAATVAVTVNNQTLNATVTGNTWSLSIPGPLAQGTYSVTATATAPSSASGTATLASGLIVDTTAPTLAITSTTTSPTNAATIPLTFTFSEDVTGFAVGDIVATGGTLGALTAVNGKTYTASLTPTTNGVVNISVAAGVAVDAANNSNTAASFNITFDNVAPTATITSTVTNPTKNSPFQITVTFSENVTGLTAGELTATNGALSNFVSVNGQTYTADVTPNADGAVTVNLPAGVAQDAAGNTNTVATFSTVSDRTAPTVAITTTTTNPSNAGSFVATVKFSENITGFTQSDLALVNATVSNFTTVDNRTFTATITPTADGIASVTVPAASVQDAAGNANTAGSLSITFDRAAPTAVISSTATNPTNLAQIPITVTFNEDVTGFLATGLTVSGGALSGFTQTNPRVYTAVVTPAADGVVTVNLSASSAQDAAGNNNSAATFSITSDRSSPTLTITSTATSPTNLAAIPITMTFNKDVVGFTAGDVVATNGAVSGFTKIDERTYTATVAPTADGLVTVDVSAGTAQDLTGNNNLAATFSITSDRTAPTVRLSYSNFSVPKTAGTSSGFLAGTFDDNSIGASSVTFNITVGTTPMSLTLNLLDKDAPMTVANFFNYLGRYASNGGVVFHRLHLETGLEIIQGGGYTFDDATNTLSSHIAVDAPLMNEYSDSHPNVAGTISMARTSDPNSATSEWFFNFNDSNSPTLNSSNGGGFAVFGSVATPADLAALFTLKNLPIKNAGGAFTELPLVDGATLNANNIVRVTSVVVNHRDNALTYSATSSNPGVATVSLSGFQNNQLGLNYLAAGSTTITITATDHAGNSKSNSFVVTVM